MQHFFLLTLSLLPGIAIGIFIYINDKNEPEPIKLLILSFFYGMVSFGMSIGIEYLLSSFFSIGEKTLTEQALHVFVIVALVEELSKFAFIRGILYQNKNFNEPLDGIVYAVIVGMGFATAENILYIWRGDGGTAITRMFSAIPAHAMFAVLMGYLLGKAKFKHKKEVYYSAMALTVATLFHGVYDYFLVIKYVPGIWIGSFVSLVIAFVLSWKAILKHQHDSPFRPKRWKRKKG